MKKHSKSLQRSEPTLKRTKARGPVQRDAKEVLAEVLGKLTGKLDAPAVSTSAKENRKGNTVGPNRDRLTVGVELLRGLPIIILTARTAAADRRLAIKSGANDYITKPFSPADLIMRVRALCQGGSV